MQVCLNFYIHTSSEIPKLVIDPRVAGCSCTDHVMNTSGARKLNSCGSCKSSLQFFRTYNKQSVDEEFRQGSQKQCFTHTKVHMLRTMRGHRTCLYCIPQTLVHGWCQGMISTRIPLEVRDVISQDKEQHWLVFFSSGERSPNVRFLAYIDSHYYLKFTSRSS